MDHRRVNYLDGFGVEQTRTSKIAETNVTLNFKLDKTNSFVVAPGVVHIKWCEFGRFHSSRMNSFVFSHGVIHMNGESLDVFTQAG